MRKDRDPLVRELAEERLSEARSLLEDGHAVLQMKSTSCAERKR
jgi:hypothetical protein